MSRTFFNKKSMTIGVCEMITDYDYDLDGKLVHISSIRPYIEVNGKGAWVHRGFLTKRFDVGEDGVPEITPSRSEAIELALALIRKIKGESADLHESVWTWMPKSEYINHIISV